MAFADPQSVTVNAVAQSLPRISDSQLSSSYRKDDTTWRLDIQHTEGKGLSARNRRLVRLTQTKIAADPFAPSVNNKYSHSVYVVFDAPATGFTNTELKDAALGLVGWLTSANILKVLGAES